MLVKMENPNGSGSIDTLQNFLDVAVFNFFTGTGGGGYTQFLNINTTNFKKITIELGHPSPQYTPYYKLDSGSWVAMSYETELELDVTNVSTIFFSVYNGSNIYLVNMPITKLILE